ncbi:serine/threonine-protein kinase [Prochlorothrix hollandica]|uniref:serine/threonine-protein kinase n=1 Tax=Prochlorothrix hollandica TaxID=1223 RepID=UPI00034ACAB0|nr:serine/threonine-protein kinase [Prochlorothrix hollandica]
MTLKTLLQRLQPHVMPHVIQVERFLARGRGTAVVLGVGAGVTALVSLNQGRLIQRLDAQVQSLFFQLRGPVAAPPEVVILAIDETSLQQGEFYRADPHRYGALDPIQSWPWRREAYALALDRLLEAEARAVALDVLFLRPSSYGDRDDRILADSLKGYGDRVVLAAKYTFQDEAQGSLTHLDLPLDTFQASGVHLGAINFTQAANGQILKYGEGFLQTLFDPQVNPYATTILPQIPSFASATLQAAGITPPGDPGPGIFFYGPQYTFQHIPFWKVLDADTWTTELDQGRFFRNKIVVIGTTVPQHQDFHPTPFSESLRYPDVMAGVEVQANAIATLAQGRSLGPLLDSRGTQALLVFAGVLGLSSVLVVVPQPGGRFALALGNGLLWLMLGYGVQTYGQGWIPVAVPVVGLVGLGGLTATLALARDYRRHQRLESAINDNADLPSVEELLAFAKPSFAQLQAQTNLVAGRILGDRYRVVRVLGMGGFSETYTAQDLHRPGQPICVIKQLKTHRQDPQVVHLVRRSFQIEATMLEKLGGHQQIPRLLAYFEEKEEFFLIQEYVPGISLLTEFVTQSQFSPSFVVTLLADLLPVLAFVHHHKVIHRDIKPSNIMRGADNGRLYLIDFGIAKAMTVQLLAAKTESPITVGLGTQGYMPREQAAGHPVFSSDLYALGVVAIQALTGLAPQQLGRDPDGELYWRDPGLGLSQEFETWLKTMVRQDYGDRYRSAPLALERLTQVPEFLQVSEQVQATVGVGGFVDKDLVNLPTPHDPVDWSMDITVQEDPIVQTQPWPQDWGEQANRSD